MKVGFSTTSIGSAVDLSPLLEAEVIELCGYGEAEWPHVREQLRGFDGAVGIDCPMPYAGLVKHFEVTGPSEDRRNEALVHVERTLASAREVDADYVIVHFPTAFSRAYDMTGLGLSAADHEAIAWRSARQLAALSRAFGVPVLIENVGPNPFFRRAGDYRRLLEAVPDLGFCLDFGHAHVLPGYEDVHAFTRALAPHVRCVHAYNTPRYGGRIGYHFPPCPGQSPEHGWMDLPSLLRTVVTDSAGIEFVIFEYQAGEGADAAEIKSRIRDVRGYWSLESKRM